MTQKLFSDFNATTSNQWKEQLIKDLKGIDFETLVWNTNSGVKIQPFYTKEELIQKPTLNFTHSDWAICEFLEITDAKIANTQALNALSNGASGLVFKITKQIDFTVLLKGILLEHIYALFIISSELVEELYTVLKTIPIGDTCFIQRDALTQFETTGNWNTNQEADFSSYKNASSIVVDCSLYQEAGSNVINELAFSLSHLNEYLAYHSANNSLTQIKDLHISVSVGVEFFVEIAKIRALRNLVNFLLTQYNVEANVHIHGMTTSINKSNKDSYTNMLRSTTEAMSASIGGCNSVLVLPFNHVFEETTEFSSRMARNQQLILKEESYLNKVADMASGSYYIENTTILFCEKAWQQFKFIESKGGLIEALKLNTVQEIITSDAELLITQVKEGKLTLVGVNKYENKTENVTTTIKKQISKLASTKIINPIQTINLSEAFAN
jgi:methylmalonyl-CoA mutase